MQIKFDCPCGQPIEFEIEPVDGAMPYPINCPSCNQDCTGPANAAIAAAKPAPVAPPSPRRFTPAAAEAMPSGGKSLATGTGFFKGLVGALLASLVGMIAWFFLIKLTGYEIGYAAWGVGGLTGIGARLLGADATQKLGIAAGICACVAILGGEYLATRSMAEKELDKLIAGAYEANLEEAREAIALKGNEAIKAFIAKREGKAAAEVTAAELQDFQDKELANYREFVSSKTSRAKFGAHMNAVKNSFGMQWLMFKESIGIFTLLWLFLGVGTAYKLGAGTND